MSRLCLPALGLAMIVFAASPGTVAADDKHAAAYEACAKACNECQRVCDACATHCATAVAEGKKEHLTLKEQNAGGNVAVLTRQLQALQTIAGRTANARRRRALQQQADLITAAAERTVTTPHDVAGINAESKRLSEMLEGPSRAKVVLPCP